LTQDVVWDLNLANIFFRISLPDPLLIFSIVIVSKDREDGQGVREEERERDREVSKERETESSEDRGREVSKEREREQWRDR
jgi:hypothetical protein